MKSLKSTLSDDDYAELKGVMWVYRKSWATLDDKQQAKLLLLFSHAPNLKQVYVYREKLTGIFEKNLSKTQAEIELNAWIEQVKELELA